MFEMSALWILVVTLSTLLIAAVSFFIVMGIVLAVLWFTKKHENDQE